MFKITKDGATVAMTEAPNYIKQAENGLPVTKSLNGIIMDNLGRFDKYSPSLPAFKSIFFKDGLPAQEGDVVKNTELTVTLKKVAAGGAE